MNILKKRSVEKYSPWPYLATMMNCLLWCFYGLPMVTPDSLLVITINGSGMALMIIYITIFFIFANDAQQRVLLNLILSFTSLGNISIEFRFICFVSVQDRRNPVRRAGVHLRRGRPGSLLSPHPREAVHDRRPPLHCLWHRHVCLPSRRLGKQIFSTQNSKF